MKLVKNNLQQRFMKMQCKKQLNIKYCNCTYNCEKKGVCCECIRYHRERNELPACYFSEESEKSYDRSFENFIKITTNTE